MNKSKYIAAIFQLFLVSLVFVLIFYNWETIAKLYSNPLNENSSQTNEIPVDILPAPC